jgi:porin
MYYNAAVTGWMNVTTDLQIIDSGLNRALNPTTGQLASIDTVVVLGARLRVRF